MKYFLLQLEIILEHNLVVLCVSCYLFHMRAQFEGKSDFLFKMTELVTLIGQKPTGCELHVNVTIVDWFLLINRTGYAISVVYAQDVLLKLLGDFSRTFKPGNPVTVFVSSRCAHNSINDDLFSEFILCSVDSLLHI